ncbi:early endosome antigen 1-like isoform X2 [Leptotrombidium deliense]|uniref:Early endosome antigen 1-like isoform X2 n=1 Tax=Leptotrombidium deliense TaxID=299467 RepID=A0A443SM19_9ACAR|nr:early endosome antigen 1-like isoform X2 [Leptotrombidium deliense]
MKGIKDMFNKITTPNLDAASQSPKISPSKSVERVSNSSESSREEAEGFLCPLCFTPFPNADELQTHYSTAHSADLNSGASVACSVCKMRFGTDIECEAHFVRYHSDPKQNDNKVDSIVQKELEKIGARLDLPSEELELLKSQIKAMEESKGLITSEVLLLRDQLNDSNQYLKEVKTERDKLLEKCDDLEAQIRHVKDRLHEEKEANLKLGAELKVAMSDKNEMNSLKNELNNVKKSYESLKDEKNKLLLENRDLVQKVDQIKFEKDKVEVRLNIVEDAKNELQAKWKLKEDGIESEVNSVQEMTAAMENMKIDLMSTKQILEETKNHAKDERDRYMDLLMKESNAKKDLELQIERLNSQLLSTKSEIEELKMKYTSATDDLQSIRQSSASNQLTVAEQQEHINSLETKLSNLEIKLQSKDDEISIINEEANNKIKILEEKCEEQESKITEKEYLFSTLQKSLEDTEKLLIAEKNRLKIAMSEHESEIDEQKSLQQKLEQELKNKELEMKEYFEKLVASEDSRKDVEARFMENVNKLEALEAKCSKVEQETAALKKECDDSKKEKEMLRTAINVKNESLQKQDKVYNELKDKLQEVENEFVKREHSLEIEVRNRNEIIEKLGQDLKRIKVQTENSIKQFDEVLNQKVELETKLSNVLDEKVSLFEKCRDFEEENEKLRIDLLQTKSKLEDTVAALHELGRENQVLQVEQTKLMSKRWTEDDEVKNCTSCSKQFSLAIRKHHCRSCLQIFCNDCSSKVAIIPSHSSNKPVRVCDTCFAEVENR